MSRDHTERDDLVELRGEQDVSGPPAQVGLPENPWEEIPDPFKTDAGWRTNLDDRRPENQALLMKALNEADLTADDVMGQVIGVEAFLCQPVRLMDKATGLLRWCPRVVLFLQGGMTVGFVSVGVVKSLQTIVRWKGAGPWNPPVVVNLRQITTAEKRRLYVLDLVSGNDLERKGG